MQLFYYIFRCYYIAEAYANQRKWEEAILLYVHTLNSLNYVQKLLINIANNKYVDENQVRPSLLL